MRLLSYLKFNIKIVSFLFFFDFFVFLYISFFFLFTDFSELLFYFRPSFFRKLSGFCGHLFSSFFGFFKSSFRKFGCFFTKFLCFLTKVLKPSLCLGLEYEPLSSHLSTLHSNWCEFYWMVFKIHLKLKDIDMNSELILDTLNMRNHGTQKT